MSPHPLSEASPREAHSLTDLHGEKNRGVKVGVEQDVTFCFEAVQCNDVDIE